MWKLSPILAFVVLLAPSVYAWPRSDIFKRDAPVCNQPINTLGDCVKYEASSENCANPAVSGIYPKASSSDPSYTYDQDTYRKSIYLPPTFDRTKPAVILFPGTGVPTYLNYRDTIIYLLKKDNLNPVWVNPPWQSNHFQTEDVQVTAEFAAYVMNYMFKLTGRQNVILGASQGTVNIQWALKYWKSTRHTVSDFIALSAVFHGTLITTPVVLGPKAVLQFNPNSRFTQTLLAGEGSGAIVNTTSIWSNQDEVISPHDGANPSENLTGPASIMRAYIVQDVCKANGGNLVTTGVTKTYSHNGVYLHPIAYALIKDAINGVGPGNIDRIPSASRTALCQATDGLEPRLAATPSVSSAAVAASTEASNTGNCVLLRSEVTKVTCEPTIKPYATTAGVAQTCTP